VTEQAPVRIGAMQGRARLVIRTEQPEPALRLVKEEDSTTERPEQVEKDEDNGR